MPHLRLTSTAIAATAVAIMGALASSSTVGYAQQKQPPAQAAPKAPQAPAQGAPKAQQAQPPAQGAAPPPAQAAQPAPVGPYRPVAIKLPQPNKDASFEAFRKQLAGIAQKKDRAGLGRLISVNFFWMPEDKDVVDKRKPMIENLSKAIGLDGRDAPGWETLATYADDATAEPDPDRRGVICSPADPAFDQKAAQDLAAATKTDSSEWGYPVKDGVEMRAQAKADAPVQEKLGLYLVRVLPDESANADDSDFLRVVGPSGKVGYVAVDDVLPLANDQLCYVKEGNAWKIAGVYGGSAN